MSYEPPHSDAPPKRFPKTTSPSQDELFSVYETVLSLNSSMARLEERVGNLSESSKAHTTKLEKVSNDVNAFKFMFIGVGGVLAIIGTAVGFILNSVKDAILLYLRNAG